MIYKLIFFLIKILSKIKHSLIGSCHSAYVKGCLIYHNVEFNPATIHIKGRVTINIGKSATVRIGNNVHINSGINSSIDNLNSSKINIKDNATLSIGENTGLTNVVIQCHTSIKIGKNVNVGAGTMIFDTDFHSLSWKDRLAGTDINNRVKKPVEIRDLAFIGAHSIILKGVTVGEKSIVGAGSVVACNIPDGEIWAGNPARFIKKVE